MVKEFVFILLGFTLLVAGAEYLIKGASVIARTFGISALVIGLTVVAFGTSAPELFVSTNAALKGTADVAIGNVVGSNMFNILVIIGIAAFLQPIVASPPVIKREMSLMLMVMVLYIFLAFDGLLSRIDGLVLTTGIFLYLFMNYILVKRRRLARSLEVLESAAQDTKESITVRMAVVFVVGGLVAMIFGSDWIVENATIIARQFGVSDLVIGITLIAVGTSLPEVAATVVAARRGQSDLAVGNALGSNLFNVLCVLGVTALITPIQVSAKVISYDNWIMLSACVLVYLFMLWRPAISRLQGGSLVFLYCGYVGYLVYDVLYPFV